METKLEDSEMHHICRLVRHGKFLVISTLLNQHLNSPYNFHALSNIQVMRIKE